MQRVAVLLSVIAGAMAQSPCNNVNNMRNGGQGLNREDECIQMGCKWAGNNCRQPDACQDLNEFYEYQNQRTGVRVKRRPMDPEVVRLCDASPECTAIYEVDLEEKFTTGPPNCNDIGMLPPHGRNQRECQVIEPDLFGNNRDLKDFVNHPFLNDDVKQNVAKAANAVTSLMEDSSECWDDQNCAYPLGFATDTILKGKSVCIEVKNANDKWVEVMASSRKGSAGGSFCAKDWGGEGKDEACTKEGDLYECRESGNSQFGDSMKIHFVAQDNTDDANIQIYWRIVASKLPAGKTGVDGEEKDAEDWCQFRDSADYPLSLLGAYPMGFEGNPVFEVESSGADQLGMVTASIMVALGASLLV